MKGSWRDLELTHWSKEMSVIMKRRFSKSFFRLMSNAPTTETRSDFLWLRWQWVKIGSGLVLPATSRSLSQCWSRWLKIFASLGNNALINVNTLHLTVMPHFWLKVIIFSPSTTKSKPQIQSTVNFIIVRKIYYFVLRVGVWAKRSGKLLEGTV